MRTSKGKPVYAAVRIVDNGGMLNINTAWKFEPTVAATAAIPENHIDGSSQMQINLVALAGRDSTHPTLVVRSARLFYERFNATGIITPGATTEPPDANYWSYVNNVVWPLKTAGSFTPFDISDELKLRNRYILNDNMITTRTEKVWADAYDGGLQVPRDASTGLGGKNWFYRANKSILDVDPNNYDYRHISTTYSIDRLIAPDGNAMFWINEPNDWAARVKVQDFYDKEVVPYVYRNVTSVSARNEYLADFAQILANIRDYRDTDSNVTVVYDTPLGNPHYGFERPVMYISELARSFKKVNSDPADSRVYRSYAIEVHKWFDHTKLNNDWRILIPHAPAGQTTIWLTDATFNTGDSRYYVKYYEDINSRLNVNFSDSPEDGQTNVDPNVALSWPPLPPEDQNTVSFTYTYDVYFGTDPNAVKTATRTDPKGVLVSQGQVPNSYNPYGPTGVIPATPTPTYYWRIDDVITDNSTGAVDIMSGDTWSFTVGNPHADVNQVDLTTSDIFVSGDKILLQRRVVDTAGVETWVVVDEVNVPMALADTSSAVADSNSVASYQRDMNGGRWIQRLWGMQYGSSSLGHRNDYGYSGQLPWLQVWLANWRFRNVGDIGYLLRKPVYFKEGMSNADVIGYPVSDADPPPAGWDTMRLEKNLRINLADPNVQKLFAYLTALNPGQAWSNSLTEMRVKGRININTAPWYVIKQLPWVSSRNETTSYDGNSLAKAIVAYRDKKPVEGFTSIDYIDRGLATGLMTYTDDAVDYRLREEPGFASIGELTTVINKDSLDNLTSSMQQHNYSMWYYSALTLRNGYQKGYPDLTTYWRTHRDDVKGDFEKRNLIFARISDLVTVRSDVFTAYILVRLGADGPQRRVIAILDRSEVTPTGGKVRIVVLQPVADAR